MTESGIEPPEPIQPNYPPPGAQQPQLPPPSYPAPGAPPPPSSPPPPAPPGGNAQPNQPPPPMRPGAPVIQPGAVPLRPLTLGDLFDATFRIVRHNTRAAVGPALMVGLGVSALQILMAAGATALGYGEVLSFDPNATGDELSGLTNFNVVNWASSVPQFVALNLVIAMLSPVVLGAARGHKLTIGQAWAATAGKRLRALGQALLFGFLMALLLVVGLIGALLLFGIQLAAAVGWVFMVFAFGLFLWVRLFSLSTAALVLEPSTGVFAACGRCWRLTQGQFWRVLVFLVLGYLVVSVVGAALAAPSLILFGLVPLVPGNLQLLVMSFAIGLTALISTTVQTPLQGCLQALLYLDQRFRKEGFDITLMTEASESLSPASRG